MSQYKYLQAWAEYGYSCRQEVELLRDQITRDSVRVESMQDEINDERKRSERRKKWVSVLIGVASGELFALVLFIII